MNFNSLVWYSSLAIGDEKNSYVANFLNRSCELLNEEINKEIKEKKFPINFKIDFLHIPKGEEGVGLLNNKLTSYTNPVFTNGHSIPKYNPSIVENIKGREPKIAILNQERAVNKNACCKFNFLSWSRFDKKNKVPKMIVIIDAPKNEESISE